MKNNLFEYKRIEGNDQFPELVVFRDCKLLVKIGPYEIGSIIHCIGVDLEDNEIVIENAGVIATFDLTFKVGKRKS